MKPIHVWFEDGVEAGTQVRRLVFEGVSGPGGPRADSWWKMPGADPLGAPVVVDSFLAGHLLWAALLQQDLIVHAPMSRGGLYNLTELMELRQVLAPAQYPRAIRIEPDQVLAVSRPADDPGLAVAAFSAGLDSTFTAVRHGMGLAGRASHRLAGLVMVHGFDAPLDRPDQFAEMRRRAEPVARLLDLPLHTVITNSRRLGGRAWPQSAIPLTAGALANFSDQCAYGLVSAGAPSGTPRFGISHPAILEVLNSSDLFTIVTDGGGYGRTDKVEALLAFPEAMRGIKVCWEGTDPSANCGVCQKCVMTRLNFLAAGIRHPACFADPLTPDHIRRLALPNMSIARDLFRTCWNELEARGITGPEVDLLRRRLARVPPDRSIAALYLKGGPVHRSARSLGGVVRKLLPARVRRAIRRRLPKDYRL